MIVRTFGERFDTFWERRVDTLEHFIEDISVQSDHDSPRKG